MVKEKGRRRGLGEKRREKGREKSVKTRNSVHLELRICRRRDKLTMSLKVKDTHSLLGGGVGLDGPPAVEVSTPETNSH